MRGAVLYRTGDVRFEEVPEPKITKPTDAIIRISATFRYLDLVDPSIEILNQIADTSPSRENKPTTVSDSLH